MAKFLRGRYWGCRYLHLVVAQMPQGMVVQSRHRLFERARDEAKRMARLSEVTVYAALSLYGNPKKDYRPGDVLDPEDVFWRATRPKDHCSECCDNCMPDSLTYKCPMWRDDPVCTTVEAARFLPMVKPTLAESR